MKKMLPFEKALKIVLAQEVTLASRKIAITKSYGAITAGEIRSAVDNPPFRQAAMDGYALRYIPGCTDYNLSDTSSDIPAGRVHTSGLKRGQAIRIFTGARLPDNADTVVAQEQVEFEKGMIRILDKQFIKGRNVRPAGSHFRKGQLLLPKGTRLNSGAIALLAQSGRAGIQIARPPKVGVLVTGDELVPPGKRLKGAEIYESNSATLGALLAARGISEVRFELVSDDPVLIRKGLRTLLRSSDLILVTGGVSVGDYDHVPECLEANGVELLFHKIRQKPGKPVLFGRKGKCFVFGLPGNPGSVISCFHTLVSPLLNKMLGQKPFPNVMGVMKHEFKIKPGLTHFLKARLEDGAVEILDGQESYKVDAYVKANVLVMVPEDNEGLSPGDKVSCVPIVQ